MWKKLGITFGVLASVSVLAFILISANLSLAILIIGIGLVLYLIALFKPLPNLGLGNRWVSLVGLIILTVLASMAVDKKKVADEQLLATLKETNQAAYLEKLRDLKGEEAWLEELKDLEPGRYAEEMEKKDVEKAEQQQAYVRDKCLSDGAKSWAYVLGQDHVKKALKAPGSAEFPSFTEVSVTSNENCSFRIVGYVDAQNSYGALLRTRYELRLTRSLQDENGWRVDSLNFIDQ